MPFNGSGTFTLPAGNPVVTGTTISSSTHNTTQSGFATGLSTVICKDGQTTTTARIPFAQGISVDDIDEKTSNTGVNIDGLLIKDSAIADTNGNEALLVGTTGSAVNEFTITNAATGNRPRLAATGGDTNIGVSIRPKGTGSGAAVVLEDGNGNEIIIAGPAVASAVNEITVTNAATGTPPVIAATGGDTNIPLRLTPKGTGDVQFTDGTDTTKVAALELSGIATATTRTITMPDANVDLQYARAASDTVAGGLEVAVQAEMEAGSSTTLAVTPGRQHLHPTAAKAWVNFNGSGTIAIRASHNVSSITDGGAGIYTVNFTTAFSSATSFCATVGLGTSGEAGRFVLLDAPASGSAQIMRVSNLADSANVDSSQVNYAAYGDQ